MTSQQTTNGHTGQDELWLICPICNEPNPSGTLHCKYCWGASLYHTVPISTAELKLFSDRRARVQKRLRLARTLAIAIGAPLLLVAVALLGIYSFTDLAFAPPASLNSGPVPSAWTMFRHDLSRSGATEIVPQDPEGTLKWSFDTGSEVASSPTVVNGVVYFGDRNYTLHALDAATGKEKWQFRAGSWIESSPAVVNGIVYFGSNDGFFYALDAASGKKLWDFETRYAVKSSPAVAGNTVYFGADDYSVYALDARTGQKKWSYETRSQVGSSPVISGGILYIGSMDSACYALDAVSGRFRLRVASWEVPGSPAIGQDDVVYFVSRNILYAMDGRARNWPGEEDLRPWWLQFYAFRLAPPPPPRSGLLWGMRIAANTSNTTPIVDGTTIYTTGDNKLLAVDLTARKITWSTPLGANIESSPALANGILYIGSNDGRLYAVRASDGTRLWDFATGARITSSPTYADGVVYVTSWDGKLYAIR
jgi:outer membrane protein assembly factor BamB